MPSTALLEIPPEEQAQMRAILRRARYGYLLAFHILLLCAAGRNPTEIAAFLLCSCSSVYRIVRAYRAGSLGIQVAPDGRLSIAVQTTVLIPFYFAGSEEPADTQQHMLGKLQSLAKELRISDQVNFPRWRNDIQNVLAAIDIFVQGPTSFIEGFCIANLKAMACGKPVIVSRNGGMPNAVRERSHRLHGGARGHRASCS